MIPDALAVTAAALGGVVLGIVAGWPLGKRMRGRPASWIAWMVIALVGGCFAAYQARMSGRPLLADAWLGVAFGLMTGIKYGGGILPQSPKQAEDPRS